MSTSGKKTVWQPAGGKGETAEDTLPPGGRCLGRLQKMRRTVTMYVERYRDLRLY